jgi:hypothetical protein
MRAAQEVIEDWQRELGDPVHKGAVVNDYLSGVVNDVDQ